MEEKEGFALMSSSAHPLGAWGGVPCRWGQLRGALSVLRCSEGEMDAGAPDRRLLQRPREAVTWPHVAQPEWNLLRSCLPPSLRVCLSV